MNTVTWQSSIFNSSRRNIQFLGKPRGITADIVVFFSFIVPVVADEGSHSMFTQCQRPCLPSTPWISYSPPFSDSTAPSTWFLNWKMDFRCAVTAHWLLTSRRRIDGRQTALRNDVNEVFTTSEGGSVEFYSVLLRQNKLWTSTIFQLAKKHR